MKTDAKSFNQAVKRNASRFPPDFRFQLSEEETRVWSESDRSRSQIVTLKRGENLKYRPYAFTEHGILMLSSVLNSDRAIGTNIEIMRTFVRQRRLLGQNVELSPRLLNLEKKCERRFKLVFDVLRQLTNPVGPRLKEIGFRQQRLKK